MKNYRYDMIGAYLDHGITEHPQKQMRSLGFLVVKSEPVPIADCWWFRVENDLWEIPGYLRELPDTFKFSDEIVERNLEKVYRGETLKQEHRMPPMYKDDGTLTDYGKHVLRKEVPWKKMKG